MRRIVAKGTIRLFWEKHHNCEHHLKAWYETARKADWKTPKDVKADYGNASIIANRVVFNIKEMTSGLLLK